VNAFRLWIELTKMVLSGRGGYSVQTVLNNPYDWKDQHVRAVEVVSWHVANLDWVGGEDRFTVLVCEPESRPEYGEGTK
jgi:hypothetical protein